MPMHSSLIPREGFTFDIIARVVRATALNPAVLLPIITLALFTRKGQELSILHPAVGKLLRSLLYAGLWRVLSEWLSDGMLNGWVGDSYDWTEEVVLITGGAGGIGGEMVKLFEEKGITVVVLDVQPLTFTTSSNVHYYQCDLRAAHNVEAVAARIRAEVGSPTVVINNAGVSRGRSVLDSTADDVRFTFDVNALAPFWAAQTFVPDMVARDHGMFVTVSSLSAHMPMPNMVDYAASKAGSVSLHEGLTAELRAVHGAHRVRTVLVQTGHVATPLFRGFRQDFGFLMPKLCPETVAEAVVHKVLSGTSGSVTLPAFGSLATSLRSCPDWFQYYLRPRFGRRSRWDGRQVIEDISPPYETNKASRSSLGESDVGESTVLVSSQDHKE
ncbi:Short-chain dehydrogenase [Geosmithia morbida]|uniref:Short-chain dehydrogenase/reductase 3 n=1 Tax=Geosmithia morbida TaxID=1094350 RepID=A0A9P4YWU5_9HYPO|nr:Short-chain dehydrogenase [Geosmithia morbida]KAF4124002.1 Short-chain dehydrogenase [Geosmithia morbida]